MSAERRGVAVIVAVVCAAYVGRFVWNLRAAILAYDEYTPSSWGGLTVSRFEIVSLATACVVGLVSTIVAVRSQSR